MMLVRFVPAADGAFVLRPGQQSTAKTIATYVSLTRMTRGLKTQSG
jgi:hypothetical protein